MKFQDVSWKMIWPILNLWQVDDSQDGSEGNSGNASFKNCPTVFLGDFLMNEQNDLQLDSRPSWATPPALQDGYLQDCLNLTSAKPVSDR